MRKLILIALLLFPCPAFAKWDSYSSSGSSGYGYSGIAYKDYYKNTNYAKNNYKAPRYDNYVAFLVDRFSTQKSIEIRPGFNQIQAKELTYIDAPSACIKIREGTTVDIVSSKFLQDEYAKTKTQEPSRVESTTPSPAQPVSQKGEVINLQEIVTPFLEAFKDVRQYNTDEAISTDPRNEQVYIMMSDKPIDISMGFGLVTARFNYLEVRVDRNANNVQVIRTDMRDLKTNILNIGPTQFFTRKGGYDVPQGL